MRGLPTLALAALVCACRPAVRADAVAEPGVPPLPSGCERIATTEALRARAADPTARLCLEPGEYLGPLLLAGAHVHGPRSAVIRSTGDGTTVLLQGEGSKLVGVTVDGSGGRFDQLDAAVKINGKGHWVEGVNVIHATFGILSEKATGVTIRGNIVRGDPTSPQGMRGDSIRIWETHHSVIEGNLVEDSRDLVVWYASDNQVVRNTVRRSRYGTHLMYSHRNLLQGNVYDANEVGVFLMYSHEVQVLDNRMTNATGAAGMGLGLKESGNVEARDNQFLHNTLGIYLDNSPLQDDEFNTFEHNLFQLSETAVVFHSSETRNAFTRNTFRDNSAQVAVEGGGDALGVQWKANAFDDYQGFDFDGDGVGDVPYQVRSLAGDLVSRNPELAFFRGSPALALVSTAGEVLPLLQPKTLLEDPAPRMSKDFED